MIETYNANKLGGKLRMTLANIKNMKEERGFTIVELLIVIVVIAILAAIVIVAYNGVQKKANTSAAQSAANTIQKKAEAFNAEKGHYPVSSTDFNSVETSKISNTGLSIGTPDADTGKTTVRYEFCIGGTTAPTTSDDPTGARITYYNYNDGSLPTSANAQVKIGEAAGSGTVTCTAAS